MKTFKFNKLPVIKKAGNREDIRAELPSNIFTFLKDAMWDNLFVYPFVNFLYLFLIVVGIYLASSEGDMERFVRCIIVVLAMKGALVYNLVKMYRSYKISGIFPVVTRDGITHMFTVSGEGKKYLRMSTMRWEDVRKLRVYRNFVSLEIKNIKEVKDDIGIAYLWHDDIPALTEHILFMWSAALNQSGSLSDNFILYSEKDESEVMEFIDDEFGEFDNVLHEMMSPDIHVDIAIIPPHEGKDFYTLCTIGAGAFRMNINDKYRIPYQLTEYAEFMMYLPSDWKSDGESLKDEADYWPIRLLTNTARLALHTDSWLSLGHTIGEEDGNRYYEKLPYNNSILLNPAPDLINGKEHCNLSSGKTIAFYQILPITQDELDFMQENSKSEFVEQNFPDGSDIVGTIINRLKITA